MNQNVYKRLLEKGMVVTEDQLGACCEAFLAELKGAFSGEESSLRLQPSRLGRPKAVPTGKKVFAIDLGGTNLRAANVRFAEGGEAILENASSKSIEGAEFTKETFFRMLEQIVASSEAEDVGFCFSYQAEILPGRDARVVSLAKELRVSGLTGCVLGEEINRLLASDGLAPRRFTVLNDTTAVFLSACAACKDPSQVAASLILGTGTNSALCRDGEIVSTESGCFAGFPRGEIDRALDEASACPGDHLAEKMIGGRYLRELIERCLGEVEGEWGGYENPIDTVVELLYDRAAIFVTAMLAALLLFSGAGRAGEEAVLCLEGSTYSKNPLLKRLIARHMESYIHGTLGLDYRVVEAENAGLPGAALAALIDTVQRGEER